MYVLFGRLVGKTLLLPSMMASLKVVSDDSTTPTSSLGEAAQSLRSSIAHLFTSQITAQLASQRGLDQFAKVNGIYLFRIQSPTWKGEEHLWTVDMKRGTAYPGRPTSSSSPPDTTYVIDALDLIALLNGKLNSAQAFLSGKLKLLGSTASAFKFQHFITEHLKVSPTTAAPSVPVAGPSVDMVSLLAGIPSQGLKCDILFTMIGARMASEPEVVAKVPGFIIQFNITKNKVPAAVWTIDTKTPGGRVYRSAPVDGVKADAYLTVEDEDYVGLLFGKLNPQRAFMKGAIKVKGNLMLLQRVNTLWNTIQGTRRDPELPLVKELLLNTNLRKGLLSEFVFFDLIPRLVHTPTVLPSGTSVRLSITKNGQTESQWLIATDANGKLGTVKHTCRPEGPEVTSSSSAELKPQALVPIAGTAELELVLDDADFVRLSRDPTYKLQEAISSSRVTVSGDSSLVSPVSNLFQRNPTLQSKL